MILEKMIRINGFETALPNFRAKVRQSANCVN
jgi:hypothetical protein